MILVADTSPLQALHRAGVLPLLRGIAEVWVPRAVCEETERSLKRVGAAKVPDLMDHPWILTGDVDVDEVVAAGGARTDSTRHRFRIARKRTAGVDQPEMEVVLLAQRLGGTALVEDREGIQLARRLGVATGCTADVLRLLEQRSLVNAALAAQQILRTGYSTTSLIGLADEV